MIISFLVILGSFSMSFAADTWVEISSENFTVAQLQNVLGPCLLQSVQNVVSQANNLPISSVQINSDSFKKVIVRFHEGAKVREGKTRLFIEAGYPSFSLPSDKKVFTELRGIGSSSTGDFSYRLIIDLPDENGLSQDLADRMNRLESWSPTDLPFFVSLYFGKRRPLPTDELGRPIGEPSVDSIYAWIPSGHNSTNFLLIGNESYSGFLRKSFYVPTKLQFPSYAEQIACIRAELAK